MGIANLKVDPLTGKLQNSQEVQDAINNWQQNGLVPIVSDGQAWGTSTIANINLKDAVGEIYQLIEYAGDLLAIGKVSQSEWFRLKALAKTGNVENLNLVREILNAKSTDKE